MSEASAFDRILASLHEAVLDDTHWPTTSALMDEACRMSGNFLTFAQGRYPDPDLYLVRFCFRGERDPELERWYFDCYYARDERVPRILRLPDSQVVHITDLYTHEELKRSATYHEALSRGHAQNGLGARLDGPHGSRIIFTTADPVDADDWSSSQIDLVRRLLPHLRQYVRVRGALVDAGGLGASLTELLDKTASGVIQLDWRGRIVAANDRARGVLRKGDALIDQGGWLAARSRADNDALQGLLARALPRFGKQAASGSLTVSHADNLPCLTVHVNPLGDKEIDFRPWRIAALVLVVEHEPTRPDPAHVEAVLGLTPTESQIAVCMAEGKTPREIAALKGCKVRTVRWHVEKIFQKRGVSRQVDLVRQILSLADFSEPSC